MYVANELTLHNILNKSLVMPASAEKLGRSTGKCLQIG